MDVMKGFDDEAKDETPIVRHKIKLSKRVNALLQLAAALIEADNEHLEAKSRVFERMYKNNTSQHDFYTNPPPLPVPRLASESVIFSPYRGGAAGHEDHGSKLDSEGRPSIDFLGIKLPTEKRMAASTSLFEGANGGQRSGTPLSMNDRTSRDWSSRPASVAGGPLSPSRPSSLGSAQQNGAAMDTTLEEWGVEKFLTSEDQERIANGRRSRANSEAGMERPSSAQSDHSLTGSKALSETGTRASGALTGDLNLDASKMDLLTRIARYREGQGATSVDGEMKATEAEGEKNAEVSRNPSADADCLEAGTERANDRSERPASGKWATNQEQDQAVADTDQVASPRKNAEGSMQGEAPFDKDTQHAITDTTASHSAPSTEKRNSAPGFLSPPALYGALSDTGAAPSPERRPKNAEMTRSVSAEALASLQRQSQPILKRPSSALAGPTSSLMGRPMDTAPKRSSLLNPAFSPRIRPCTPDDMLAAIDPYPEITYSGLSPYPALRSPPLDSSDFQSRRFSNGALVEANERLIKEGRRGSMAGLSTRQLQELAKGNSLPSSYEYGQDEGADMGEPISRAAMLLEGRARQGFAADLSDEDDLERFATPRGGEETPTLALASPHSEKENMLGVKEGDGQEFAFDREDLPSLGLNVKGRASMLTDRVRRRLSTPLSKVSPSSSFSPPAAGDEIDDDYTSPPTKGPLCPKGLEARLPRSIVVPQPLQGTSFAPQRRLVEEQEQRERKRLSAMSNMHVPKGFVLHNRVDGVPMKALPVRGPTGLVETPVHAGGGKKDASKAVTEALLHTTRIIAVPRAAPAGIGRRAAMNTTSLFRNQLVQHEEEMQGWGWEKDVHARASWTGDLDGEDAGQGQPKDGGGLAVKKTRQEKRAAKKLQKEKRKRKAARRVRRGKRAMAESQGIPYEQVGVDEFSPDEDLDLSASSSEQDDSDEDESDYEGQSEEEEARRLDEMKPAGILYGKSLLDVMDSRKKVVTSKARHYGQVTGEEQGRDDVSMVASSIGAPSFRDNPVGFNDTRERMEAAFGPDPIWAREMAKREEQEREEALELQKRQVVAEEKRRTKAKWRKLGRGRKGEASEKESVSTESVVVPPEVQITPDARTDGEADSAVVGLQHPHGQTSLDPPMIQLSLPQDERSLVRKTSSLSSPATPWYDAEDDDEASDDSEWEAKRRKGTTARPGLTNDEPVPAESESDSSEDDNVPLSRLRGKKPQSRLSSPFQLQGDGQDSDEEEEMPLSQLVEHRRKTRQSLGTLDLNFMLEGDNAVQNAKPERPQQGTSSNKENENESDEDEDEDMALGLRLANAETAMRDLLSPKKTGMYPASDSDDDDDRPLGAAHPQAAIIAEQASLIQQLQAEIAMEQRRSQLGMPMPSFTFPMNPHMSFLPGPSYPLAPPLSDMGMSMMAGSPMLHPLQQREDSIVNWASQIPPDGSTSAPHSRLGSDRSLVI